MTGNNAENVSKRSFSHVCRMAIMLVLLGEVLIMLLSGHTLDQLANLYSVILR